MKYVPPYSDSFIILSVYYKGSISVNHSLTTFFVQLSNFYQINKRYITDNKEES